MAQFLRRDSKRREQELGLNQAEKAQRAAERLALADLTRRANELQVGLEDERSKMQVMMKQKRVESLEATFSTQDFGQGAHEGKSFVDEGAVDSDDLHDVGHETRVAHSTIGVPLQRR